MIFYSSLQLKVVSLHELCLFSRGFPSLRSSFFKEPFAGDNHKETKYSVELFKTIHSFLEMDNSS